MTERPVDLRSDTVTRPTPAMLAAMSAAPVGDDVWGDDPTVAELYRVVTRLTGKEAALLFPTGTQCNLAAVMAHCGRGDEVILGRRAHVYAHEAGGASVLGGISFCPVENRPDGTLPIEAVRDAVRSDDIHHPRTGLICLENTFNGVVLPSDAVAETAALAAELGLPIHLDGARAWNAAVASGVAVEALCAPFDTVSLCFSKGLGTPAGSVLVGSGETIRRALRLRKMLGGGMRQSGLFAAACLHALDHHVERLAEDHRRAAALAEGLRGLGMFGDVRQATNMVFLAVPRDRCARLEAHLADAGILAAIRPSTRLVTHLDIDDADIDRALRAFAGFDAAATARAA